MKFLVLEKFKIMKINAESKRLMKKLKDQFQIYANS